MRVSSLTLPPSAPSHSRQVCMGTCHWQVASLIHTASYSDYLIWWGFTCISPSLHHPLGYQRHYHLQISHVCKGFFIGHSPGMLSCWWAYLTAWTSQTLPSKALPIATCFSSSLFSLHHAATADLPRHTLIQPICNEFTQHRLHRVNHLLQQLLVMYSYSLPTISACSTTFSSRLYVDCDGQSNSRIATTLLTCLINFSSLSTTNVAGLHLLSSSATFIKWDNALPMHGWAQAGSHSILLKLSDLVRLCLLVLCPTLYHISHAWKDQGPRY